MPRKKRPTETPPDPADPVLPAVNPVIEDHLVPKESLPFPIVAVGASAGGLEAITSLLNAMPTDSGMALVVVQHLSPTHESMLADILTRATSLPVREVENNMEVEPNQVYVIPPNKNLVFGDGMLQLAPRTQIRGQQRPIDHFMRSLAEEQGHKAIGVVLSGSGNDGSLGVQEIKAAGGITFAQDDTAEQTSMPRSAIAAGAIDFVLPPEEIAKELGRIARHPYVGPATDEDRASFNESAMQRIFGILRHATGVDFNGYKRNTIQRRIKRRMVLHKLDGLHDYVRFLQSNPGETDALYQDLLINVTSFFRNPEAYEALKTVVFPKLTEERSRHEQVRIWALGCSTGEEAYSLAMSFTEYIETTGQRASAQIFATDLNGVGVEKARHGLYAKGIVQDVSPERLRRFFIEVDGSYRIAKPIRDMCVFARQNVLADPPFSRLDLVACRNMLIYLEPSLQQQLIPMLHYSLRNHGFLWLGGSETVGSYRDLFEMRDAKHKIYAKKSTQTEALNIPLAKSWEPRPAGLDTSPAAPRVPVLPNESPREADRALLGRYAPPAVVVNEALEIMQFHGDTSPFLSPAPGRASLELMRMLREGLIVAVRSAVRKATQEGTPVREEGLRVRANGGWRDVNVEVIPLRAHDRPHIFVVVFEEPTASLAARTRQLHLEARATADEAGRNRESKAGEEELGRLKQELSATRDYLQSVIEQQEAANEELQSANEEVQSANEELQSINEELETSKEEIQSSNEELATVNEELQTRNLQLSLSNDDLTNLLASVQLAIVMLGPGLRIRRFTPAAEKLFSLLPGDVGRPLSDIKLGVDAPDLEKIVHDVIESMAVHESEVQDRNGRWYSLRVRPYRTLENRIDGAVIVLVDVDAIKQSENAIRESEARFEVLANSAPVLIWLSDLQGCHFVNRAFEDFVGKLEAEIRQSTISHYVHPDDREAFDSAYRDAFKVGRSFEVRARFRRSDGVYRWMKTIGTPRFVADGQIMGYVGGTFDVTDMKEAEAALVELDRGKNEFLAVLAHELRNPLSGVRNASSLLASTADESIIKRAREIIDRQTEHMVSMIDDLLDISRVTHGKIQLRKAPLDLAELVRRVIDATALDRERSEQEFAATLPEGPVWILGDQIRLEQVVSNLLHNATKFTRRGGQIWITLTADALRRGTAMATLRVRDNGLGIDPVMLPRVFELFVQGENPQAQGGMGLGLTLAKRLIELHGGRIEAFSAGTTRGSEFVIHLPLLPASEVPKGVAKAKRKTRVAQQPQRVLIVDDNRDSAETMDLIMKREGHETRVVLMGGEALPAALSFKPDVILLDIGMPDIDGYEVARKIRADKALAGTLIIATTGYGRDEDVRRALAAGIDEHLTKPVEFDLLLDRIARAGENRPG